MPPLYFIANRTERDLICRSGRPFSGSVRQALQSVELEDLFSDVANLDRVAWNTIKSGGPGGAPGLILSVGPLDGQPGDVSYQPDVQAWQQVTPDVWIGSPDGKPPRPVDLERHECCVTHFENVVLGDADVWEVPVIRRVADEDHGLMMTDEHRSNLPNMIYRAIDRQWVSEVMPQYRGLWAESRELLGLHLDGQSISYVRLMEFAVAVLSLRYRFSLLLHSRWPERFITTANVAAVVRPAIGWTIIARYVADEQEKKKRSDLAG